MKRISLSCAWLMGLMIAIVISGCASTPRPKPRAIFLSPDISALQIEPVCLLPIVDRRVDKSKYKPEELIGSRIKEGIEKIGYKVNQLAEFYAGKEIPNDEVAEMDIQELSGLGPENANTLLIVFLDDASGKTSLGYSFKIEATGILLDKKSKSLLWKDKGIGSSGQGGLIGIAMAPMIKSEASNFCIRSMLKAFPEKNQPTQAIQESQIPK